MIFVILIAFILKLCISVHMPCSFYWDRAHSNYNICPLELDSTSQNQFYVVNDARYSNALETVKYYFNLGSPVIDYPSDSCATAINNLGPCDDYTSDSNNGECTSTGIIPITWKTWAYQQTFDASGNIIDCQHMTNFSDTSEMDFRLATYGDDGRNVQDPTDGLILKFQNGDYDATCPYVNDKSQKNQYFELKLLCGDDMSNIPDQELVFYNEEKCLYWMRMKSVWGCPIECKQYNSHLCGGNGVCAYDFTNSQSKCVCFDQYESTDDCSVRSATSATNVIAANNAETPDPEWSNIFPVTDNQNNAAGQVTYDMSVLHLEDGYFEIVDINSKWVYLVDLDSEIDPNILPESCKKNDAYPLPCMDFNTDDGTCQKFANIPFGQGMAFRHKVGGIPENSECQLIATVGTWQLYDETDAGKGVSYQGTTGSFCSDMGNANSGGNINFMCSNGNVAALSPPQKIPGDVMPADPFSCQFDVFVEAGLACPWNCLTKITDTEWNVCSLHGTCLFDPIAKFTRCVCDVGYAGANCQNIAPSGSGSNTIFWIFNQTQLLLIAIISLCVILLILSLIFWRYYCNLSRKYRNLEKNQALINDKACDDDFGAEVNVDCNSLEEAVNVVSDNADNMEDRPFLK